MSLRTSSRTKSSELGWVWWRLQEVGFIILFTTALFGLAALVSYDPREPTWSGYSQVLQYRNAAGAVGAWLSDLLFSLFGLLAYLFPLSFLYSGLSLLYRRSFSRNSVAEPLLWVFRSVGLIGCVLAGTALLAHYHPRPWVYTSLPMGSGGVIGQLLNTYLAPSLGVMGATLLNVSLLLMSLTLATGISWFSVLSLGKHPLAPFVWLAHGGQRIRRWGAGLLSFKRRSGSVSHAQDKSAGPSASVREYAHRRWANRMSQLQEPSLVDDEKPRTRSVSPLFDPPPSTQSTPSHKTAALPMELLQSDNSRAQPNMLTDMQLTQLSRHLEARLEEFGIQAEVVAVHPGPVITQFELAPAPGVKVSRIVSLAKDLARALSVSRVRVVEVIPGKSVIGLEIPNPDRELVSLRSILGSAEFQDSQDPLTLALGKDIAGKPVVANLARMPHLLVAGTTGSGKSVGINAMLLSLLYKSSPETLRLILIDPKMLELSVYEGIPHLLCPVVTDMKEAAQVLRWCVTEMEHRYQRMASLGVRHIEGFNEKVRRAEKTQEPLFDPLSLREEEPSLLKPMPYIVVIIDEFADMMMVVGKKVEELIARMAQKARAAGIHLILATQRPSVDVITGLIKANIPARMAFQVASRVDSRTILDQMGAEQLLGYGDTLYLPPGAGLPIRVHGAFVSDEEVHAVVNALRQQGEPDYVLSFSDELGLMSGSYGDRDLGESDALYDEAVRIVLETRKTSISSLQRRLKIGYNRAARLIEAMEAAGLLSPVQTNGNREVLVSD